MPPPPRPERPRPPAFGIAPVAQVGTRYVIRWPDTTPADVLAAFEADFRQLCQRYQIREEGTSHFIQHLKDASH